jgi:glycosyltransferase involved in cell wall biosynthesis
MTDKLTDLVFLEEAALAHMDAVYGPSHLIAKQITQATQVPVSVIETPFFNEVKAQDSSWYHAHLDGVPYVMFFGRLGLMKGIRAIADATFGLLSKYPDLRLVLIGQNAAYNERSALEIIQENAGVHRGRVLHFDKLAHEKLYPVIEHAQAVLLPSRIDNLSNTCIESMGLGQIVIGTNGASFEQLIVDGESGFLCEIDDANSLLAALDKAMHLTPAQRTAMSQNAQKRIERLRPEWTVNQLLAFYQEVIALKKGTLKRAAQPVNALNPSSV